MSQKICVVGAGLAAVAAARSLAGRGHSVTLFEKSRGFGGRLATRRFDGLHFDHGAAFFTVRDASFREALAPLVSAGEVVPWTERLHRWDGLSLSGDALTRTERRWAAGEGMASVARRLAEGLDVRLEAKVTQARPRASGGWSLDIEGSGPPGVEEADILVVAIPAPQALALFGPGLLTAHVRTELERVAFDPCLTLLATFDVPLPPWRGIVSSAGPVQWVGSESSKRPQSPVGLTIQGSGDWSRQHYESSDETVKDALIGALAAMAGAEFAVPVAWQVKRWRYARPVQLATAHALLEERPPVVFCGDWAVAPRAEGAWMSGVAAADRLVYGGFA